MLILKRPMQLQSISGIQMYSDKLGEKIIANYQLIGMEITSVDLLHMMMQEPELFLNSGSFGIMTIENPVHITNQIKLEMINQLVNRLMLYFSPDFTYQDEVFVASVLQKIGIFDVNEFMQQIHRHMDHNLLVAKLFHFYGSQNKKIAETVHFFQTRLQQSYQEAKANNVQNAWDMDYKFAYYLHNKVFERLMTAECNHILYSYYCQMDKRKATVQGVREAVWAEQADVIQLSQMCKIMFCQTNPVAWQEDIYYERKHFAQESLTEEMVVQRIVAAILENMIQKLHGVWLREKSVVKGILWRDYKQTFYQSATDVFERFWYFQSKQTIEMQRYEAYLNRTYILKQNEWKLTQLLNQLDLFYNRADKENAEREVVLSIWENQNLQKQLMGRIQLEERLAIQNYLRDIDLQEEQEYQAEINSFQKIRDQWTSLKQQMQNENSILTGDQGQSNTYISQEIQNKLDPLSSQEMQNSVDIVSSQQMQNNVELLANQEMRNNINIQSNQEMHNNLDILQQRKTQKYFTRDLARNWNDKLSVLHHYVVHFSKQRRHIDVEGLPYMGVNHTNHSFNFYFDKIRDSLQWQEIRAQESNASLELLYRKQNQSKEIDKQESKTIQNLTHIIGKEDKKVDEESFNMSLEYLQNQQTSHYNYMDEFLQKYAEFVSQQEVPFSENKRLLDKINQHNLQMKHRLDSEDITSVNKNAIRRVVVDPKKARQSALRALENPQEALREIYTHATAIEEELPLELERILRITDENTQLFYRQLLGYQNVNLPREQNRTQDNNLSNIDTIKNHIQDNNLSNIDVIKKEEQELNKLKLNELSSENNKANLESIKTRIQFPGEKEIAVKTNVSNFLVEKLFDTCDSEADNTNGQTFFNNIEITLKQIEEREHKIYLESVMQRYTDVPKRLYLEHQFATDNKTSIENGDLQESQKLLEDKGFVKNAVLLENKVVSENLAFLQKQEWRRIDFAHKPELQLTEYLEDLENRVLESSDYIQQRKSFYAELEQLKQQQIEQRQVAQQQLQDIRHKLLRENQEQLTQMVNHSLKTQAHAISDIVYHELERRLKNEQRRRGY